MISYDELAESYEPLHEQEQLNKLRILANEIKPKGFLLDVGCGSGLSRKVFSCKIAGIDLSINMLKKAKGIYRIQAVGEHLPLKDKSFEAVICVTSLHNFEDYKKGLKEMKRVSKGKVGISLLRKAERREIIEKEVKKKFGVIKMVEEMRDKIFLLKVPSVD